MKESKNTVVILGGGIYGVSSANHISRELDLKKNSVKLVTPTDHAYFLPSSVRLPFSEDYSSSMVPLEKVVDKDVEIIEGVVDNFTDHNLLLDSGACIEFDVLVIATGSKWPDPIGSTVKFGNDYKLYFEEQAAKINKAKSILFLGGGFVACETIGEFLHKFGAEVAAGKKNITVVHSDDKLLPANGYYGDRLRSKVTNYLESKKVKLILDSKGTISKSDPEEVLVQKRNGLGTETIKADVIYQTVGAHPSVPSTDIPGLTDDAGCIRVSKTFQVQAVESGNVFAIGDVTNIRYRGILKRDEWVDAITKNVISFLKKDTKSSFVNISTFEDVNIPSVVSLGPEVGFGQFPLPFFGTVSLPKFLAVSAKSKSLFKERKEEFYKK